MEFGRRYNPNEAVLQIEKDVLSIAGIYRMAATVESNGRKIKETAERIQKRMEENVAELLEQYKNLKASAI